MEDHEHDEDGNCILPEDEERQPIFWRFSPWNIAGIALTTVGGFFGVLQQGLNMAANECWTMAKWVEEQRDKAEAYAIEEAARAEMAETYERLVGMDSLWLGEEAEIVEDPS